MSQVVALRDAQEGDLPRILEILNVSLEKRRLWFQEHGGKYPIIVAEIEDKLVCYCSISSFDRNSGYARTVELSVYVDQEYKRKGIGRSLVEEIIHRARDLGHHVILSSIAKDNEPSKRLHEVLGFEYIGCFKEVGWKFSKWQDTTFYELLL